MYKCSDCNSKFHIPKERLKNTIHGDIVFDVCPNCNSFDLDKLIDDMPREKATRHNQGKPQWSQIHYKSVEPMIRVLEFGAQKYNKKNWQKPMDLEEIQESAQRHLAAVMDGEIYDKESGELHMAHVMTNCMFWIYHFNKNKKNNNE